MDTTALLARLVGALSPSLLHPDEIFQAAEPLSYLLSPNATPAATIAWEWRCDAPIRSLRQVCIFKRMVMEEHEVSQ
jgi:Alg9-like mannosyltransferase family